MVISLEQGFLASASVMFVLDDSLWQKLSQAFRIFSSIPGIYSLNSSSFPYPGCVIRKSISRHCQISLREQNCPALRTLTQSMLQVNLGKKKAKNSSDFFYVLTDSICMNIHYLYTVTYFSQIQLFLRCIFSPLNVIGQDAWWI